MAWASRSKTRCEIFFRLCKSKIKFYRYLKVVLEIDPAVNPKHKNTLISMVEGLVQESISHQLRRALREFFGFDRFKGHQEAIIESICEGQDTFVIMPTGAGKSLCYQLPAVISPGTAIIISPLIALMKNQVDAVRSRWSNRKTWIFCTITKFLLSPWMRPTAFRNGAMTFDPNTETFAKWSRPLGMCP